MDKPNIVEVISRYVSLRRRGRNFIGPCPFHSERTPSFTVSEERGRYHCFGCDEDGDVITFIEKMEELDFKGALVFLNLKSAPRPRKSIEHQTAEAITTWASEMSLKVSFKMRDLLEQARLAKACLSIKGVDEALESYERQWEILNILDEDLFNPQFLMEI